MAPLSVSNRQRRITFKFMEASPLPSEAKGVLLLGQRTIGLYPGIIVAAPVLIGTFPVDSLGGAAVDAAQAPYALGFDPCRLSIRKGNGSAGADLLT